MPIKPTSPAFPIATTHQIHALGVNVRTYMATRFVAAEIGTYGESDYSRYKEKLARRAVEMADALIDELNKPSQ